MSLRLCAAATALVFMACIVSAASAQARPHHHAYRYAGKVHHHRASAAVHGRHARRSICLLCDNRSQIRGRGGLVTLHTRSGKPFIVAAGAAHAFSGFVGALEREGYRIAFIGGYRRHGSVAHSLHPRGLAIDINQLGRNRVTRIFPAGVTQLAARFGLLHGAVWDHPDTGHFEVAGMSGRSYARLHRHRRMYAELKF